MRNSTQHEDEPYLNDNHSSSNPDGDCTQDYGDDESSHPKKTGKWTSDEDKLLRKYVPMYGEKQWRKISEHIPGRSSIQCLHRWTKILKPGLVKGPWTAEEDQRLIMWVKTEGPTKWAQAANFITGRSGKQCRERWFNNLNPDVKKGNWSKEEDELIYELYQKYGTSWSKIAKLIPGRTENAIKNRFYSTLRKLAADQRKSTDVQNTVQGTSQKSESAEEAYDPVGQNPASPGDQYGVEPPNTLYKLLQEKTQPLEGETPLKLEMVVKGGKEVIYEPDEGPTQNTISNQKSYETGRELLMMPMKKVEQELMSQQQQVEMMMKKVLKPVEMKRPVLTDIEFEKEGWTFERFLLSLDGETNPNESVLRENESKGNHKEEGVARFDKLQQKILNYCQDNIHSLAEAFKTMAGNNSDASPSISTETKTKARTVTQILPMQPKGFKIEASPGGFYQENIKGIKISAPMPVTRINYSNKSNPSISPFGATTKENANAFGGNLATVMKHEDDYTQGYAMIPHVMMSNKSSPARGFESPQINNLDLYEHRMNSQNDMYLATTTPVKNKVPVMHNGQWDYNMMAAQQNRFSNMNMIETPQNITNMANMANITNITNMTSMASMQNMQNMQNMMNMAAAAPPREGEESDKKINFLFQQLYSLEGLLANARNELLKLEGTLNETDDTKDNYKILSKDKPVREYNEMFGTPGEDLDQIVKKRKQM